MSAMQALGLDWDVSTQKDVVTKKPFAEAYMQSALWE